MNTLQLLQDHNIPAQTDGHKHCRPGWVNIPCLFCTGSPGLHLGINLTSGHFYCWRCGWKPQKSTWAKILNTPEQSVRQVLREYGGVSLSKQPSNVRIRRKAHKLPSGAGPLLPPHTRYLKQREFEPEKLEKEWGILGTGPISRLDHINLRWRIVIPIHWEGKPASFQTRDITNRSNLKYITCPKEREIIHHKHILYGRQELWRGTGICVEGVTDVWRFGPTAFATFGIEFTNRQIKIMVKSFKRICVLFDDEPQAVIQANKLVAELQFRGVDAWSITIAGDPGDMSQDDADRLVKSILG